MRKQIVSRKDCSGDWTVFSDNTRKIDPLFKYCITENKENNRPYVLPTVAVALYKNSLICFLRGK